MITKWSEICVEQYQEIINLESDDNYSVELISVLMDISVDDLEDLTMDDFEELLSKVNFINKQPTSIYKNTITVDGIELYKLNLDGLLIGEFVDLENLIMDIGTNLPTILSILYRMEVSKQTKLHKQELEPYGDWIFHRGPLFSEVPITDVYGVITEYLKYRSTLFEAYSGLFDDGDGEEEDDEYKDFVDVNETGIQKRERLKTEATESSIKKWGWDSMVHRLAGGDTLKIEGVFNISIIQGLNTLAIQKELNI